MIIALSVTEFNEQLSLANSPKVIDVREPKEFDEHSIPGSVNIPLTELNDALSRFDTESDLVFVCKTGVRSLQAANFMASLGYQKVANLSGGIHQWQK